jgi:hypothetical protein
MTDCGVKKAKADSFPFLPSLQFRITLMSLCNSGTNKTYLEEENRGVFSVKYN